MTKNNQPSCTRGNPPTEADKGKIWVYWDENTPHYIRADNPKEAWVEMLPRLSPRRWAEILTDPVRGIDNNDIIPVCWEDNETCYTEGEPLVTCELCSRWRPDRWMEGG